MTELDYNYVKEAISNTWDITIWGLDENEKEVLLSLIRIFKRNRNE